MAVRLSVVVAGEDDSADSLDQPNNCIPAASAGSASYSLSIADRLALSAPGAASRVRRATQALPRRRRPHAPIGALLAFLTRSLRDITRAP